MVEAQPPDLANLPKGGFWIRLRAFIIDLLTLGVVDQVVTLIFSFLGATGDLVAFLLMLLIALGYFPYFWKTRGETPGMCIVGLRVLRTDGSPVSFGKATARLLGYPLSALPLLIGFIWVSFNKQKQGWHDKIAGTYVVRVGRIGAAALPGSPAGGWSRLGAWFIDLIILGVPMGLLFALALRLSGLGFGDLVRLVRMMRHGESLPVLPLMFIYQVFAYICITVYYTYFLAARGATPGKMFLGLQVVSSSGSNPSLEQALIRYFSWLFVSPAVLGFGFISIAFNEARQGWHDRVAGTYVVKGINGRVPRTEPTSGDIPGLLAPPATTTEIRPSLPRTTDSAAQDPSHFRTSDQLGPPLAKSEPSPPTEPPLGKASGGSYIFRHWRGELSLPISYWVNGVIVSVISVAVIMILPWDIYFSNSPKSSATAIGALWILIGIISIWQLVGTWRSANNYLRQGESKLWGNLAKVLVVLNLIRSIIDFASIGIPQIAEYAQIAIGKDPVGTYRLRVLRDSTELEIAGALAFGVADDVRRTLDAHPTVHIIHLNSDGGRVGEARNLRDLIDSRGLTTFTSAGCFSACTLAYAAGHNRLIAKDANLGFHQYSFPGVKAHEFQDEYKKDKQDWLARGFARDFVDRAYATPNNEMWTPTHRELFEGRIVTGYPEK